MTSSLDPFFTPEKVAAQLVAHVKQRRPALMLDPAAGDGALLKAGEERWPDTRILALDCDPTRVRGLGQHGTWSRGRCDFLSQRSRRSSPLLRDIEQRIDVVLLNPPYTARGNARWRSTVESAEASCGRAMAFVLTALDIVRDGGEIVALLPSSTVTSQRDAEAWDVARKFASVEIVERFPRGTFREGTASTVGVHITKCPSGLGIAVHDPAKRPRPQLSANLIRGSVPVHEAQSFGLATRRPGRGLPFLHSTDLHSGTVPTRLRSVPARFYAARELGPAVMLPRVGKPLREKVAIWPGGRVVMSDCLFAIATDTPGAANDLGDLIRDRFDDFAEAYGGSCAPYLTIASLVEVLSDIGVAAHWRGPSRWIAPAPRWSDQ